MTTASAGLSAKPGPPGCGAESGCRRRSDAGSDRATRIRALGCNLNVAALVPLNQRCTAPFRVSA